MVGRLVVALVITGGLVAIGTLYAVNRPQHIHQLNTQSGAIQGQVVYAEGQPVSGAVVYARKADFVKGIEPFAHSDKQGRFIIRNLTPGTYTVYGGKEEDGYPLTTSAFHSVGNVIAPQVNVNDQQTTSQVVVQLGPKAAKLAVRIVDAATTRPIEEVSITLRRVDNANYMYSTGPNGPKGGGFEILVPSVPVTVEVQARGYEKWNYRAAGADAREDVLHLAPGERKDMIISLRRPK